jgi:YggT family protein
MPRRRLCYNVIVASLIVLVDRAIELLTILVVVRVLLSWVPSVDYGHPLISLIVRITDPILQPVRRVLPPVGGLDLSPIISILLLNLVGKLLHQLLVSILYAG